MPFVNKTLLMDYCAFQKSMAKAWPKWALLRDRKN